jgi:ABC-type transporter Mla MlaB component
VVAISGPITRSDIPRLCERFRSVLEDGDGELILCDMAAVRSPDAVTLDALARLQLTARRSGRRVQVRHACTELRDLMALAGLLEVVPCAGLALEAGRQAEKREPPRGVEEEGDPPDSVARDLEHLERPGLEDTLGGPRLVLPERR